MAHGTKRAEASLVRALCLPSEKSARQQPRQARHESTQLAQFRNPSPTIPCILGLLTESDAAGCQGETSHDKHQCSVDLPDALNIR